MTTAPTRRSTLTAGAASPLVGASAQPERARAPLDHASLLIALALVADVALGQHRLAPWLVASVYFAAVTLVAWTRSWLVQPLAIAGVALPLALGELAARPIAAACVQAAILAAVMLVRRRTRAYYEEAGRGRRPWRWAVGSWRRRRAPTHCRRWRRCAIPR